LEVSNFVSWWRLSARANSNLGELGQMVADMVLEHGVQLIRVGPGSASMILSARADNLTQAS
jgi:hypothetical protein